MQNQSYTWLLEQWAAAVAANRHETDDEHALSTMLHALCDAFDADAAHFLACHGPAFSGIRRGWRWWCLEDGHAHGQTFHLAARIEAWWSQRQIGPGEVCLVVDEAPLGPVPGFLEGVRPAARATLVLATQCRDQTRACLVLFDGTFANQDPAWETARLHKLAPLLTTMADWAGRDPQHAGFERFMDVVAREKNLITELCLRRAVPIWVLDESEQVVFANQTALELADGSLENALGLPLWHKIWGARAAALEQPLRQACDAARRGRVVDLETPSTKRLAGLNVRRLNVTFGGAYVLVSGRFQERSGGVAADPVMIENLSYFENLERINQLLRGKQEVGDMLDAVKVAMLDLFDCDRVWLLFPCNLTCERYEIPAEQTRPRFPGALAGGVALEASELTRETLRALLAQDWPIARVNSAGYPSETYERFQIQSELSYVLRPIVGEPWLLGLHQCSFPRVWTEQEKRLLRDIGLRIGDALGNLLLFKGLSESHGKYKNLYEQAMVGMFRISSAEEAILLANPYCRRMLGYDSEFQGAIHLAHHFCSEQDRAHLKRLLKEQGAFTDVELRMKPNQGPPFWVKVSARYFAEGGFVEGVALSIDTVKRSIAALEESEKRLSSTLLSIGDGVIASDIHGCILRINPVAAALTGWAVDDAVGQPVGVVYQTYEQEGRVPLPDPAAQLLRDNHGVLPHRDVVLCDREGQRHLISETGSLIRGERGNLWGTVIVFRDISAERELEGELNQVRKLESIGLLAGGIAHDFNNLLNGILGYSEILEEDLVDHPDLQHYARVIGQTCRRAADLVYQLLSFSRKGKRKSVAVDMHGLLGEVVAILRRTIDRRIEIGLTLTAQRFTILGDPSQLESALINLGVNARDAMPDGGRLQFATYEQALDRDFCTLHQLREGPYLRIEVADNGSGMEKETLEHIFEPFFTTKEPGRGTGLGLAAVFGTVKSHNGLTRVSSAPGQGTIFRIWLPLQPDATVAPSAVKPTETKKYSGCVLVVEDEELLRDMAADLLTRLGYRVVTAVDGLEALSVFERERARLDWVLLDMVMPRLNGTQTLARLRAMDAEIPIVMTSGFSVEEQTVTEDNSLADGFIQKPFGKDELSRMIAKLFEAHDD